MRRLVMLTALLCACGTDYSGRYVGELAVNGSCSDGSGGSDHGNVTWNVKDEGDTVTATPESGKCGSYTATMKDAVGTLQAKSCGDGSSLSSGALNFTDKNVGVSMAFGGGGCSGTISGTLTKQ